uniref:Uncharacterized protein n=1 Tax=Lygus hesperus TaxID=30085 RepID=A0A0A9YAR5_LYGHE
MPVFTDFPSVDSCLRCHGEERCPWHSDIRFKGGSKDGGEANKASEEVLDQDGVVPHVVAKLPPELFYNYNPSGPSVPSYNVLPLPSKRIWEENIRKRLSLEQNPHLKKTFEEARRSGRIGPVRFPNMGHFRFDNYHVRYIPPKVKPEWRLYRPDNAPRPRECGKGMCKMEIHINPCWTK